MQIHVIAIGQRQPRWADQAVADFLKRMPAEFKVKLIELKAQPRSGQPVERIVEAEAERLRAALPAGAVTVALDERGRDLSSTQFAELLARWRDEAQQVAFAIGGPDGLAEGFKRAARMTMRLSSLTLPHALARLLLIEQLYRGWSILSRHPYHRS